MSSSPPSRSTSSTSAVQSSAGVDLDVDHTSAAQTIEELKLYFSFE